MEDEIRTLFISLLPWYWRNTRCGDSSIELFNIIVRTHYWALEMEHLPRNWIFELIWGYSHIKSDMVLLFLKTKLQNYTIPLLGSSFRQAVVARWLLKTSSSFGSLEIITERERPYLLHQPHHPETKLLLVLLRSSQYGRGWTLLDQSSWGETVAKLWSKWKLILWETAVK